MSWLFGMNKGQQGPDNASSYPVLPGGEDDKSNDRQGQNASEAYRFDSAALERAARAAKELEKSRMYTSTSCQSFIVIINFPQ